MVSILLLCKIILELEIENKLCASLQREAEEFKVRSISSIYSMHEQIVHSSVSALLSILQWVPYMQWCFQHSYLSCAHAIYYELLK